MPVSELTLTGGERIRVAGSLREVEAVIIAAARGSIMELAWVVEADSGQRVGVNPEHVITLRSVDGGPEG